MSPTPSSARLRPTPATPSRAGASDAWGHYSRDIEAKRRLTRDEEDALGAQALLGDHAARNALVEGNLRLVPRVVRKFLRDGVELTDLVQAGNEGLLRAAEKWDPARRVPFGAYAPDWIERFAREIVAKDGYATRIPLYRQEVFTFITKARVQLEQRLGRAAAAAEVAEAASAAAVTSLTRKTQRKHRRPPTPDEIHDVQVTAAEVDEAEAHGVWGQSLDAPSQGEEGDSGSFGERLPDVETASPADRTAQRDMQQLIDDALDAMPERERTVLIYYFGLRSQPERTLEQIGALLGLTRERVRQIKEKAVQGLRSHPVLGVLAAD